MTKNTNRPTLLSKIRDARNPDFRSLGFTEIDRRLRDHLSAYPSVGTAEALTEAKLDEFTAAAITTAELFIEYHLCKGEIAEAADFADDVADLKAEAAA